MKKKQTPFYFTIETKTGQVEVPINRAARKRTPYYFDGIGVEKARPLLEPQRGKWSEEQLAPVTEAENARQRAKLTRVQK